MKSVELADQLFGCPLVGPSEPNLPQKKPLGSPGADPLQCPQGLIVGQSPRYKGETADLELPRAAAL